MGEFTKPNQFCFCTSLRTGCLILGYVGLVIAVFGLINTIVMVTIYGGDDYKYLCSGWYWYRHCYVQVVMGLSVGGVEEAIRGLANIGLIIGVYKCKPFLLFLYLIVQASIIVLLVITLFVLFVVYGVIGFWGASFLIVILGSFFIVVLVYFFMVVRVYWHQLIESEQMLPTISNTAELKHVQYNQHAQYGLKFGGATFDC